MKPYSRMSLPMVVLSPPGITSPSRPPSASARRTSRGQRPEALERHAVLAEVALQGEDADRGPRRGPCAAQRPNSGDRIASLPARAAARRSRRPLLDQPRILDLLFGAILDASMPSMASPSPTETSASTAGSS